MITNIMVFFIGCILGFTGIVLSERIRTDEGAFYQFSTKWRWRASILSGGLAATLVHHSSDPVQSGILIGFAALFAYQYIIDCKYQELANEWNALLLALTILYVGMYRTSPIKSHLIAGLILTAFFFMLWLFTDGLGFGDVKFLGATSWLLTVEMLIPYLVYTLLLASISGVTMLILLGQFGKKEGWKMEFAFGPFLIVGMVAIPLLGIGV